ncbi:hypothetical protein SAXI111661_07565 [Saccharomonospora xinjiangensis]|uniref:hypothetical protein n=1 Tax=Saccharomonospora xinjiangensis TaxID=75294 RepID=UPI00106F7783|nr:hypothetical protein [Saccharomonospora xinjiangensis]QBQ59309.1 hypothetical protein EYD13_04680 [Saccharomonospora xinjiangensis]
MAEEFSEQGQAYNQPIGVGGIVHAAAAAFNATANAASMAKARAAASELVNSAKNGGFRVSKDSANELIDIMAHFVERIDNMKHDLLVFNQRPPLGNHEYGKLVAQHMYDAANGPNSARMVVHQLKEVLKMSIEALQRASGQYEETESSVVDAVKRSTRSV